MARENVQELEQAITDIISAAGAPVPVKTLIETLEASGKGDAAKRLLRMQKAGAIVGKVTRQEDGSAPVLTYSLPE